MNDASRTLVSMFLLAAACSACTSAGAPTAADRGQMACEVGEQRVCTGARGSRLEGRGNHGTCSCEAIQNVQQF